MRRSRICLDKERTSLWLCRKHRLSVTRHLFAIGQNAVQMIEIQHRRAYAQDLCAAQLALGEITSRSLPRVNCEEARRPLQWP